VSLPRIRVVAALVKRRGRILVQQRGPKGARALLWEFPGGKVEPGESDEAALARECREEMGVAVEVGRKVAQVRHAYADLEVDLILYGSEILEGGEPKALHAHALRWIEAEKLLELPFCEADVPFLEGLKSGEY
jgi:8-oxo-dGTP diphosphatase